ncbi:B-cell linker protein isoform X9 [Anolis carolinensis]|uniref:B-cell linker protein isoform X9 n=1 Tax=Anolis carolinensis TaxID=28377 RepID=UPI002F2B5B52
MATKLPFREECENWTASQVADLLKQCGMHDCARTVGKLQIDGARFLNLSEYERNRFSIMDQPQLQKIVHDIKKNDSGIMSKFKKFQNEHVALICKTGKNTWDRLTSKAPPSVPPVDYEDEEQWSDDFDSDYENPDNPSDSETYVVPSEENCDDSYEPPPSEQEKKQLPAAFSCSGGEYADNKRPSQQKSWPIAKPLPTLPSQSSSTVKKAASLPPPSAALKPKLPPKLNDDEADYVIPVDDEEDNYIEPTEESPPQPVKHVYEVPEEEETSSPPLTRNVLPIPRQRPPSKEPDGLRIQNDENHNNKSAAEFKFPSVTIPSPLPRITKKLPNPAILPKPTLPERDHLSIIEDKPIPAERRRGSNHELPLPPIPPGIQKPLPQKPPTLLRSEPPSLTFDASRKGSQSGFTTAEQDGSVYGKAWYMASSDRKTAEDALYKSNKDGSFLVRKSSGQDSKQPYTLVVFYNKRVYNIPIRFIESTRQYALGREKTGEERFDSVAEIIENHQRFSLVLIDSQNNTKDSTKLKHITRVS